MEWNNIIKLSWEGIKDFLRNLNVLVLTTENASDMNKNKVFVNIC